MSVETGIPPEALVSLDEPMWRAVVDAHARRWTPELELAAQTVELTSAVVALLHNVHAKKGTTRLRPVSVPRPTSSSSSQRSASSSSSTPAGAVGIVEYARREGLVIEPVGPPRG